MEIFQKLQSGRPENTFQIVKIDDEGWAAFKSLEAKHRSEYATSPEAVAEHDAWVNSPQVPAGAWCSAPPKERKIQIIPSPTRIPWEQRYDWSLVLQKPTE